MIFPLSLQQRYNVPCNIQGFGGIVTSGEGITVQGWCAGKLG